MAVTPQDVVKTAFSIQKKQIQKSNRKYVWFPLPQRHPIPKKKYMQNGQKNPQLYGSCTLEIHFPFLFANNLGRLSGTFAGNTKILPDKREGFFFGTDVHYGLERKTHIRKKLVANRSRCERIYKRTGDGSVTFCGEEEQGSGRMFFFKKRKTEQSELCSDDGAEDGNRTRVFSLGS